MADLLTKIVERHMMLDPMQILPRKHKWPLKKGSSFTYEDDVEEGLGYVVSGGYKFPVKVHSTELQNFDDKEKYVVENIYKFPAKKGITSVNTSYVWDEFMVEAASKSGNKVTFHNPCHLACLEPPRVLHKLRQDLPSTDGMAARIQTALQTKRSVFATQATEIVEYLERKPDLLYFITALDKIVELCLDRPLEYYQDLVHYFKKVNKILLARSPFSAVGVGEQIQTVTQLKGSVTESLSTDVAMFMSAKKYSVDFMADTSLDLLRQATRGSYDTNCASVRNHCAQENI